MSGLKLLFFMPASESFHARAAMFPRQIEALQKALLPKFSSLDAPFPKAVASASASTRVASWFMLVISVSARKRCSVEKSGDGWRMTLGLHVHRKPEAPICQTTRQFSIMPTGDRLDRVLRQTIALTVFVLIIGFLRWAVFEIGVVMSDSMQPTLKKGDTVLVDHRAQLWQRGQVVLFSPPSSWPPVESGEKLVKRIIGLPGETVEVGNGAVSVNGKILSEPYLGPILEPDDGRPIQLGPTEYFVLGDNRDNSDDSRSNGPINSENIQSRVVMVLLPSHHFGRLSTPSYGN